MRSKMLIGVLVIAMAAAMIGGATMAWFTATADGPEATFTAGTVDVSATGPAGELNGLVVDNWNPGDSTCVCWTIVNDGSKDMVFKVDPTAEWSLINLTQEQQDAWNAMSPAEKLANITIDLCNESDCPDCLNSGFNPADWRIEGSSDDINGYTLYYIGPPIVEDATVDLCLMVTVDGPDTDNKFQGGSFSLGGTIQAVQSTNGAPESQWELSDELSTLYDYLDNYYANNPEGSF